MDCGKPRFYGTLTACRFAAETRLDEFPEVHNALRYKPPAPEAIHYNRFDLVSAADGP